MFLDRRAFLRWTGATALAAAASATGGCAKPVPAPSPGATAHLLSIGLYSWSEFLYLPAEIQWLGLSYARIGGVMSDALMTFSGHNNLDVLLNVTPAVARTEFDTDGAFIDAYLTQVDAALNAYGPDGAFWKTDPTLPHKPITQIEVCNEPNFGYGFSGSTVEVAALYAQLLVASYDRVKKSWPSVKVVGFAAGGASNAAPGFLSAAFAALQGLGRLDAFDVVSLHPYSSNQPPEQAIVETWGTWVASESMDAVRQLMIDFRIDKPLWVTEVGYQISHADGGMFTNPAHTGFGTPETVTPMQQAAYTIRMNMSAVRHDISRVYHMSATDTDNYNGGWFGPVPGDEPRPVAVAMRQVIQLLGGATYFEVVLDGGTGSPEAPFAYRFSTPNGPVLVAWCQVPAEFNLPIDSETETAVTDMLGNTIARLTDSFYMAGLSENPIFLHSATADK